jgi:hypothetical protein
MSSLIKAYIKVYLNENNLQTAVKSMTEDIKVQDVIDTLKGDISKKRFKKIGLGIFKFCSLGTLDVFDAISDVGEIVDPSGAIKDTVLDALVQKAGSMGLAKTIDSLRPKKQTQKNEPLNIDPYYSNIIDDKIEKKFIVYYIGELEKSKNMKLKDFILQRGDISSILEIWLKDNFGGRSLNTQEKKD